MSISERAASLFIVAMTTLSMVIGGCERDAESCLRMSDCESGYTCTLGTCRSDTPVDIATTSSKDSGTTHSTVDASVDATSSSLDASATDASVDGSDASDASSDAQ